ncbi:MAG TPA: sigma-70 family RNA polymerase sigma factor [Actinophytocola sp.]|uniref:sigma-70 family RNA polymerase sigma factor n=1 Tax=Actinophytocola sp. TaxID=1872138 RepID=UPI002DDD317E|nr:sigma-70 family RNA polymerase sigma factor [Actinophytocola sp.]HEV2778854.1 sigma-70 family RNA polymerase sigma factor [Actinophytocola sp.]
MTVPASTRARPQRARPEPSEPGEEASLFNQYLNQIAATPLLSAAEEVELAKQIEAGVYAAELLHQHESGARELSERDRADLDLLAAQGQRAKCRMIRANLRLVVSVAKKYFRRGQSMLDLVQEGNLGLIRAVEKFDYTKGFKFSTYAVWWIRQSIDRGLAQYSRTIRLPMHVVEDVSKLARVERDLQIRLGREPSEEELAEHTGFSVDTVHELRRLSRETISLDTPIGDDGDRNVGDLIEDTEVLQGSDVVEYQAFARELRALVDTLPPREAMIITLRYGLHDGRQHTLAEIAERLGYTRERIRQLEKQALAALRDPERHQPLLSWAS